MQDTHHERGAPIVLVSTAGFVGLSALDAATKLLKLGAPGIELSAGLPESCDIDKIIQLSGTAPVAVHNYYPSPRIPFVMNLSSSEQNTVERTLDLAMQGIRLTAASGFPVYALHAGFCGDVAPESLGGALSFTRICSRDEAIATMSANMSVLCQFAAGLGVSIALENHCLTRSNFESSGNCLLMTDPVGIHEVLAAQPKGVGLLLDVGHLKVSSSTLGFDLLDAYYDLSRVAMGLHLSNNNGVVDSHSLFDESAWFMKNLPDTTKFTSVEVRSESMVSVIECANAVMLRLRQGYN